VQNNVVELYLKLVN